MHTFAGPPFVEGEHLVENSAKLKVLDKLITKVLCALACGGWGSSNCMYVCMYIYVLFFYMLHLCGGEDAM